MIDSQMKIKSGEELVNFFPNTKVENVDMKCSTRKSLKDDNDIFTKVELLNAQGVIFMSSVLSGGASPNYTTRVETSENITTTYTRTYDDEGMLISEVIV